MIKIQAECNEEEDAILKAAAELEGRSKRSQLRHSAILHARSILPPEWKFKPSKKSAKKKGVA